MPFFHNLCGEFRLQLLRIGSEHSTNPAPRPINPGRAANISGLATLKEEVEDTPTPRYSNSKFLSAREATKPSAPSVSHKRPSHPFLRQQNAFHPDHPAYPTNSSTFHHNELITILAGPEARKFQVHKGLLCHYSGYFPASSATPASTAATKAPQLLPPAPQPPTRSSTAGSTRSASSTPAPSSTASRSTPSSCWTYGS